MEDIIQLFETAWQWQSKTFDTSPIESVSGLIVEAKELEKDIQIGSPKEMVLEEGADVMMYLLYIIRKMGYTLDEFIEAFRMKLDKNLTRKWKKRKDGCFQHQKKAVSELQSTIDTLMEGGYLYLTKNQRGTDVYKLYKNNSPLSWVKKSRVDDFYKLGILVERKINKGKFKVYFLVKSKVQKLHGASLVKKAYRQHFINKKSNTFQQASTSMTEKDVVCPPQKVEIR